MKSHFFCRQFRLFNLGYDYIFDFLYLNVIIMTFYVTIRSFYCHNYYFFPLYVYIYSDIKWSVSPLSPLACCRICCDSSVSVFMFFSSAVSCLSVFSSFSSSPPSHELQLLNMLPAPRLSDSLRWNEWSLLPLIRIILLHVSHPHWATSTTAAERFLRHHTAAAAAAPQRHLPHGRNGQSARKSCK